MAMMLVDGVALPTPSTFEWGMIDVSASDSGRTQDAKMHKNRIAQKRQLKLSWSGTNKARTAQILQMVKLPLQITNKSQRELNRLSWKAWHK